MGQCLLQEKLNEHLLYAAAMIVAIVVVIKPPVHLYGKQKVFCIIMKLNEDLLYAIVTIVVVIKPPIHLDDKQKVFCIVMKLNEHLLHAMIVTMVVMTKPQPKTKLRDSIYDWSVR